MKSSLFRFFNRGRRVTSIQETWLYRASGLIGLLSINAVARIVSTRFLFDARVAETVLGVLATGSFTMIALAPLIHFQALDRFHKIRLAVHNLDRCFEFDLPKPTDMSQSKRVHKLWEQWQRFYRLFVFVLLLVLAFCIIGLASVNVLSPASGFMVLFSAIYFVFVMLGFSMLEMVEIVAGYDHLVELLDRKED